MRTPRPPLPRSRRRALPALLALLLLVPTALARVDFGVHELPFAELRDAARLSEACAAPDASSFMCELTDATLTRIPTKGVDYVFDASGELVAAFSKQQKGQRLNNYSLDARQNLIPDEAAVPGLAVLVDGEYVAPTDVEGGWTRVSDVELEGRFAFTVGDLRVERVVVVSNETHTLDVTVRAERLEDGEPVDVQLAVPGIARSDSPVAKIGSGGTFSENPLPQPVADPSYVSIQTGRRSTGQALVLRPDADASSGAGLEAVALEPRLIALQEGLAGEAGAGAVIAADLYAGPHELIRYTQEGYADLPGLFSPNILGRMSLGIVWVLVQIHELVGNWGLSIIVLTLLFRALIWPLIQTQTKSMYGMQALQPKIKALQEKYKDDREKLTQETMKLYQEAGVNPAGGCLPIVLQMPLFIILWRVFVNFEFGEGFLWIPDLGQADPFFLLPAAYVGVMVAQSFLSAKGNRQMLQQQLIMNLVFVFIMVNFPAGVLLYFVTSMLVQVIQYWLIGRNQPAPVVAASGAGGGGLLGMLMGGGQDAGGSKGASPARTEKAPKAPGGAAGGGGKGSGGSKKAKKKASGK